MNPIRTTDLPDLSGRSNHLSYRPSLQFFKNFEPIAQNINLKNFFRTTDLPDLSGRSNHLSYGLVIFKPLTQDFIQNQKNKN